MRRDVVEMSFVRIALLILETDLDRDARKVRQIRRTDRKSSPGVASADRQELRLAQREIDVDQVGLHDGCECGRSGRTDEIADIDLVIGNDAIERGENPGKAEVDIRGFEISLINSNSSLVLLGDERLIVGLLRRD